MRISDWSSDVCSSDLDRMATANAHTFSSANDVDLNGKSVLVTGGTGSFGQKFVRTVLERYKPRRVIVFSRDELKQFEMGIGLSTDTYPSLRYFIEIGRAHV